MIIKEKSSKELFKDFLWLDNMAVITIILSFLYIVGIDKERIILLGNILLNSFVEISLKSGQTFRIICIISLILFGLYLLIFLKDILIKLYFIIISFERRRIIWKKKLILKFHG